MMTDTIARRIMFLESSGTKLGAQYINLSFGAIFTPRFESDLLSVEA